MSKKALLLLTFNFSLLTLNAQTINTIAGNGTSGYSGDGGPATAAELSTPTGVFPDASGNIYIADELNNRVRIVNSSGIINTIAGNGTQGFSGDGGPATASDLNFPTDISTDNSGNLYIDDYSNNRIRKVNSVGIISTVAGNGIAGYSGDGGPATAAEIFDAWGACCDASGNIYIADGPNDRIRKVNTAGIITTIAGNGTFGFSGDGGPATAAELSNPCGVYPDGSGNIYIAEYQGYRIRLVNSAGIISSIAGNGTAGYSGDGGPATAAEISWPTGVCSDGFGNVYIAELQGNRIRIVNTNGIITTLAGNGIGAYSGDGGPATAAELNNPSRVYIASSGDAYVADRVNNRIRKISGGPLAVNQPSNKTELNVYPNPNNGSFYVSISHAELVSASHPIVEIYNMLGEKVYSSTLNIEHSTFSIDLSSQPNGIYLLKLQSEDGTVLTRKIEITK